MHKLKPLILAVATVLASFAIGPAAHAAPPICKKFDRDLGVCLIWVTPPRTPPGGGGGGGGPTPVGHQKCIRTDPLGGKGEVVPCSDGIGFWSGQHQCYVSLADPQPPLTDVVWGGHTNGAIYMCFASNSRFGAPVVTLFWSPVAPPVPVDPAKVARQAVASMGLRAIDIGIVPEPGPNSIGIVGMPVWMWVNRPAENTFGPITRSATAGGVTVTATAKVTKIIWGLGDGATVTCTDAGTPYADSYGKRSSPTCGHTYTKAKADYLVSAHSYWAITWRGGGRAGTINMDFTAATTIHVGEVQVLVTNG
jgi:hypothetical protein